MTQIIKATYKHVKLLSTISSASFLTPHGHSAPKEDIENYIANNFSEEKFMTELRDQKNEYYLLYYKEEIAGFSKIIFNTENKNIEEKNIAMLSRIYLLEKFYDTGLGKELFNFNISIAKQKYQAGVWLAVWVENHRAIAFYKKRGFKKVGAYDFKISEKHSNPNHILYLKL